jgi:hypothetical protein
MPNAKKAPKSKRLHRSDPPRAAPNRSGKDHVRRNATPSDDDSPPGRTEERSEWIAGAVQKSVAGVVNLGYEVIERQIQEGRLAAERLRAGLATSTQLNADVNNLVEGLVATTKDVGATWLDLLSIILRSVGQQAPCAGPPPPSGQTDTTRSTAATTTRTGTSGAAATVSSITPVDPASPRVPPAIEVTGIRVRRVTLDLRPTSMRFVPLVRPLAANDPQLAPLTGVRFELSADQTHSVLRVNVPRDQAAAAYTGAIVDSSTNEPGGSVIVVVGN